ncbi:MAG: HAD family hydrolase [Oscillospiraceae bacterium]|jgi:Cof subfamily protein (haloacid dehalogenase superfamily)|nr:HAD family hydrolase [Oscillospiraceae bacterium]
MGKYSEILLVSDFDMTLTNTAHEVPKENIDAVNRFMSEGGSFTIATGRARKAFEYMLETVPVNAPCIYSNGGLTYDHGEGRAIEMHELTDEAIEIIVSVFKKFPNVGMEMYQADDEVFVTKPNSAVIRHMTNVKLTPKIIAKAEEAKRPWLKVVFAAETEELLPVKDYINSVYGSKLTAMLSLPYLLDIQRADVSKGRAARSLANRLGKKTLVCAGDAANDLAMLEEADIAFVPQSAEAELLQMGYRMAAHCDAGAIASVIDML